MQQSNSYNLLDELHPEQITKVKVGQYRDSSLSLKVNQQNLAYTIIVEVIDKELKLRYYLDEEEIELEPIDCINLTTMALSKLKEIKNNNAD